jgi:hypothetical protein
MDNPKCNYHTLARLYVIPPALLEGKCTSVRAHPLFLGFWRHRGPITIFRGRPGWIQLSIWSVNMRTCIMLNADAIGGYMHRCISSTFREFSLQSTGPNRDLPRLPISLPVLLVGVHGLNGHGLVALWAARTHLHHEPLVSVHLTFWWYVIFILILPLFSLNGMKLLGAVKEESCKFLSNSSLWSWFPVSTCDLGFLNKTYSLLACWLEGHVLSVVLHTEGHAFACALPKGWTKGSKLWSMPGVNSVWGNLYICASSLQMLVLNLNEN